MSRLFDGNDDSVASGTPAKLQDLPVTGVGFSVAMWFYRTGNGVGASAGPKLLTKTSNDDSLGWQLYILKSTAGAGVADTIQFVERRVTSIKLRRTSTTISGNNIWHFLAITVAVGLSASDVHVYLAAAGASTVAEASYAVTTNGVGAYQSDVSDTSFAVAASVLNATEKNVFQGRIAEVRVFGNKILSQNEIDGIYFGTQLPRPTAYYPLWGLATPEVDLSDDAANGTVSEAVLADHAPVGRWR